LQTGTYNEIRLLRNRTRLRYRIKLCRTKKTTSDGLEVDENGNVVWDNAGIKWINPYPIGNAEKSSEKKLHEQ
jgi:hypothetical protein